jgi:chloramphenicol-sensitive protein RarD
LANEESRDFGEARLGVAYGVSAYVIWGFTVIYWKWLFAAGAMEVLAHRIVWASLIIGGVLVVRKRIPHVLAMIRTPRVMGMLVLTGALLAVNWSIFVWSVLTNQILQASLGYYINPLISVLIGYFLLHERMSRLQTLAVASAVVGVVAMLVISGSFPWPAMVLAVTFAVYGYLRKVSNVVAMDALFVEMTLFVPVALGVIYWLTTTNQTVFGPSNPVISALLILGGLVTFLPLAFFGESIRRIRLTTAGFLQYIAPTIQFFLAVLVYGEHFSAGHVAAFGCIWVGLILYSIDAVRKSR